jgi:hypothetical protein
MVIHLDDPSLTPAPHVIFPAIEVHAYQNVQKHKTHWKTCTNLDIAGIAQSLAKSASCG